MNSYRRKNLILKLGLLGLILYVQPDAYEPIPRAQAGGWLEKKIKEATKYAGDRTGVGRIVEEGLGLKEKERTEDARREARQAEAERQQAQVELQNAQAVLEQKRRELAKLLSQQKEHRLIIQEKLNKQQKRYQILTEKTKYLLSTNQEIGDRIQTIENDTEEFAQWLESTQFHQRQISSDFTSNFIKDTLETYENYSSQVKDRLANASARVLVIMAAVDEQLQSDTDKMMELLDSGEEAFNIMKQSFLSSKDRFTTSHITEKNKQIQKHLYQISQQIELSAQELDSLMLQFN